LIDSPNVRLRRELELGLGSVERSGVDAGKLSLRPDDDGESRFLAREKTRAPVLAWEESAVWDLWAIKSLPVSVRVVGC